MLELATSIGIIALTSLLYVALRGTVRWIATVAFALWVNAVCIRCRSWKFRRRPARARSWGLASVGLVLLATLPDVWGGDLKPPILLFVASMPLELSVGIWLLAKGSPARRQPPA